MIVNEILVLRYLHWLSVVACVRFKTVVLAFKAVNRTALIYLQSLVRLHVPAPALHFTTSAGRLVPPSLRANKAHSVKLQLFSVLGPQWRNKLLTNVRNAESLAIFYKKTPDSLVQTSPEWNADRLVNLEHFLLAQFPLHQTAPVPAGGDRLKKPTKTFHLQRAATQF